MAASPSQVLLFILTWPYYRTLVYYTIAPATKIATCTDQKHLSCLAHKWAVDKRQELGFVKIAVSILTSEYFVSHYT